jgi:TetR/AcrR family transcriptional repressor of nem operon
LVKYNYKGKILARPLSFNPKDKLNIAMDVFWQNGFNESSLAMLLSEMKINKYSLYQQFGNKEALFGSALTQYNELIFSKIVSPLSTTQKGKAAIMAYLDSFNMLLSDPRAKHGCLIMNTLLAGDTLPKTHRDQAKGFVRQLHTLLTENFEAEKNRHSLKLEVKDCVNFTLMTIQALLNARKTQGLSITQSNIAFFKQTLKSW